MQEAAADARNMETFFIDVARELATVVAQSQRKTVDALLHLPSAAAEPTASAVHEVCLVVGAAREWELSGDCTDW